MIDLLLLFELLNIFILGIGVYLSLRLNHQSFFIRFALFFLLGGVAKMILLAPGIYIGNMPFWHFLTSWVMPIAVLLLLFTVQKKAALTLLPRKEEYPLVIFGAFLVIFLLVSLYFTPLISNDARAMWTLKAKYFAQGNEGLTAYATSNLHGHSDYPNGVALLYSAFFFLSQNRGEAYIGMLCGMYIIAILSAIIGTFKEKIPQIPSYLLVLIGILTIGTSTYSVYGLNGYVDVALSFSILMTVLATQQYLKAPSFQWLIVAIISALGAMLTKNEGLTWGIFSLIGVAALYLTQTAKPKITELSKHGVGLLIVFGAIGMVITWELFKQRYSLHNDVIQGMVGVTTIKSMLSRIQPLIKLMLPFLLNGFFFGVLWIPALITWVITTIAAAKKELLASLIPSALIFLQFGMYVVIYLVTPHDLTWHVSNSFDRLLLHLIPSVYVLAIIQLPKELKFSTL